MSLGNLCELHQLREMVDFGTNRKVVVCQSVRSRLQFLAPCSNEFRNLFVLLREGAHLVAELRCLASPFDLNLASQSFEFVDVPGANLGFNCKQLQVKLLLIRLL